MKYIIAIFYNKITQKASINNENVKKLVYNLYTLNRIGEDFYEI